MSSYNWPEIWKRKTKQLETANLNEFRASELTEGLEWWKPSRELEEAADLVARHTQPEMMCDSLVGKPPYQLYHGYPITLSSVEHAYMANSILEGVQAPKSIVEIGGGFGGLAYSLRLQGIKPDRYVMIDHPSCLELQEHFISETIGTEGFDFIPIGTYFIHENFDLTINTRSFGEMEKSDVEHYMKWCWSRYFYQVNSNHNKKVRFDEIPMDNYEVICKRNWPWFQHTNPMTEALYRRK